MEMYDFNLVHMLLFGCECSIGVRDEQTRSMMSKSTCHCDHQSAVLVIASFKKMP